MKKEFYLVQKFSILLAIVIIGSGFLSCENQFFKEAAGIYEVNFESNGGTKVSTVNTDRIVFSPVTSKTTVNFLAGMKLLTLPGMLFPFLMNQKRILFFMHGGIKNIQFILKQMVELRFLILLEMKF